MNVENYETIDVPSRDEGKTFLTDMRERGILTANLDDLQTRMKLIQLGLAMPKEKERWLLFDPSREDALYTFFRLYVPVRGQAHPWLIVFRFDIAKYRSDPLAARFGVGDACALFCRSGAVVVGLNYMKFTPANQAAQLN
jgi:hypothetical protein